MLELTGTLTEQAGLALYVWRTYAPMANMALVSSQLDFKILISLSIKSCFHLLVTLLISSSPPRDDQLMKCLGLELMH